MQEKAVRIAGPFVEEWPRASVREEACLPGGICLLDCEYKGLSKKLNFVEGDIPIPIDWHPAERGRFFVKLLASDLCN